MTAPRDPDHWADHGPYDDQPDDCPACHDDQPGARPPWQHADDCPRYAPRPRGPGSTEAARIRAMQAIKDAIARAKEGHR